MNIPGISTIVDGVSKLADDLFTSDEERLKIELQTKQIETGLLQSQHEINKAEAQHSSVFVAGWRPFIGWVGGAALAYQFLLYPLLIWLWYFMQAQGWISQSLAPPPPLDAEILWVVVSGMLGIAGMRSYDKLKKTQTDKVKSN
ncbi:holin family protein [Pleionea sp. CnH1-48]|uniref:holin family protein n=1 Tax=Pleionea sp. CnH1-48 TaxID=2954494 RepID=UPI002097ECA6|nr:holin family protein [Pleionea sp. CnH1-48]MCO7226198.1 holin family protein [Pleionea sp. CnH1-48]